MAKKRNSKKKENSDNTNLPKEILAELKKDNIAFSKHIYREKYASEENDEEDAWDSVTSDDNLKKQQKLSEEDLKLKREEIELQKRQLEAEEKYREEERKRIELEKQGITEQKQTEKEEQNSLKNLIEKHNGNEDSALQERIKFLKNQGHDDGKIKDILESETNKIQEEKDSNNAWEQKRENEQAKNNRRQEIANISAIQKPFAHAADVYDKVLGRHLAWAGDKAAYGIGWILLVIILIGIYFGLTFAVYTSYSEQCSDLRQDSGFIHLMSTPFSQSEFAKCVRTKFWDGTWEFIKTLNFVAPIVKLFQQQVNYATGGLYYAQVDQNAKEPTGLFIKNINKQDKYYTDEPITVSADIEIKTINSQINGFVSGYMVGLTCDELYPQNGIISVDQDTTEKFICTYNPNSLSKTKDQVFEIIASFNSKNIAYMRPTFTKRTAWNQYTDAQKKSEKLKSLSNSFKDSNAPMRIAGEVGTDTDDIILINDYSESQNKVTFPIGISLLTGDTNNGWTEGKVKRINQLFFILPAGITMQSDAMGGNSEKEFKACRGYTFEKIGSCSDLKNKINDKTYGEFLCEENENIYSLVQDSKSLHIKSFDEHFTFNCLLETDKDELFKNQNGEDIAKTNEKGIKIFSDFQYTVEKDMKLNVLRRFKSQDKGLTTYSCPADYETKFKNINPIELDLREKYSQQYQNLFEKYMSRNDDISQKDFITYEALAASITNKYSQFNIKEIVVDSSNLETSVPGVPSTTMYRSYLTGCLLMNSNSIDGEEKDIECLFTKLSSLMKENGNDPKKSLSAYYALQSTNDDDKDKNKVYNEYATIDDYNKWLYTLCDKSDWEVKSETSTTETEVEA